MRRAIAIALSLGAACLLLYGCSSDTNPTDLGVAAVGDSADKRPPNIYDPPPGFDPYLISLENRFATVEWDSMELVLDILDEYVTVTPKDGEDIEIHFEVNPNLALPAAGTITWDCTIWVPKKPASGATLYVPGDCIIFKTKGFPDDAWGAVSMHLPIMEFYDTSSFTGNFTSFVLEDNSYGYPGATEINTLTLSKWPETDPEITVYLEVPAIKDLHTDSTSRAVDPEDIGDEEE